MFWKSEEENFKKKPKEVIKERIDESKINAIVERLESITQQVNSMSRHLAGISKRVGQAVDASLAYQKDLDDFERRIGLIKSKIDELENVVPEVELEKKLGKKAG
jgi:tetrahydromethanopterin S-methyltransferase subunit G